METASGVYSVLAALPPLSTQTPLPPDYSGIESIHSQKFSVAIFIFMLLAIALFAGIAASFILGKNSKAIKTGEKWLFVWIFLGIVVSIVFGALQLLGGYLF
ncbi:MAG: hypothetical protein AB1469_00555 [Pseudomonadota bacterium]